MTEVEREEPKRLAEIVTPVEASGRAAVAVKEALVEPSGTRTAAGSDSTAGMELERETVTPPAGAGPSSVMVPVAVDSGCSAATLNESPVRAAGTTTSWAVRLTPAFVTVTSTLRGAVTGFERISKDAAVAPGGTTTSGGRVRTAGSVLVMVRNEPDGGAARVRMT